VEENIEKKITGGKKHAKKIIFFSINFFIGNKMAPTSPFISAQVEIDVHIYINM